jgi:hypothetical protein
VKHVEERPSWDCRACGKDWPCGPAREQLAAAMDRVQLAMTMWGYLERFSRDSGPGPPVDAFDRFIAWTR